MHSFSFGMGPRAPLPPRGGVQSGRCRVRRSTGSVTVCGMNRLLRTVAAIVLTGVALGAVPAAADTAPPTTSGCAEYGERSVSTGTVVDGSYRIAAFCFGGTVDGSLLRISGRVVGGGTGTCAAAYLQYRSGHRAPRLSIGRVCGGTATISTRSVPVGATLSIEACLVDTNGSILRCSGRNIVNPAGKTNRGPIGNRR